MRLNATGKTGYQDCKGNAPPLPGRYHVAVNDVEHWTDKNDPSKKAVIVEFQVLSDEGTTPGQSGRTIREFFQLNEKEFNVERLLRLALIAGLVKPGEDRDVDIRDSKGCQLVIGVSEEEYKGQKKSRVKGMDFWAIGDPDVSEVPLNRDMLAAARAPASSTPASSPPPAASGANGSGWEDL